MTKEIKYIERKSGIELLKIIAMFFIVLSHVAKAAGKTPDYILDCQGLIPNLNYGSINSNILITSVFRHFGSIGSDIFFICTAWFIIGKKTNYTKVCSILLNFAFINYLFLAIYIYIGINIDSMSIINAILPNTMMSNWFVTCYVMLYLIHEYLDIIIDNIDKRKHFTILLILIVLYSFIASIFEGAYFATNLTDAILIYWLVSYIKRYKSNYYQNKQKSIRYLLLSITLLLMLIFVTNYLCLNISIFRGKAQMWNKYVGFLQLCISISSFILFLNLDIKNKYINFISSLTLIIYLTHENQLFRHYTMPKYIIFLIERFGYSWIVWIIFAFFLFIVCIIVSYLYIIIFGKVIEKLSRKICLLFEVLYEKIFTISNS